MAFQFRYQRILDVRELEEDQEQARFAEIQNQLTEERQKLRQLQNELEELFDRARESRKGSFRPQSFSQFHQYAGLLQQRIESQKETVERWEEKLEAQREELIEASQKRQVMETLKEQEFEEFREEMLDREAREQDEIANQQYHREYGGGES